MSKSNIEKERLNKIKQFENNIVIDSSLFKVKVKFFNTNNKFNKKIKNQIKNIDKEITVQYEKFFTELICKHLHDLKIYDFTIHLNIEHHIIYKNSQLEKHLQQTFVKVKAFIYHRKTLISNIEPLSFKARSGNRYLSNLYTNQILDTFEIGNDTSIQYFLKNYILKCPEIYNDPHFFQIFQVNNHKQCVAFLHEYAKSKIPNILNKSDMYLKVTKLIKFMHLNKKELGINGFTIRYDFASKEYNSLALKIPNKAKEPVEWFFVHETSIFKNNLEVFQCLKKNKFINFNIDDLSEDEVIEMFPILNY